MKISWDGLEWNKGIYYFHWVYVNKRQRQFYRDDPKFPLIGFFKFWYDYPHAQLNLWCITFYWSFPWTSYDENNWKL